MEKQAVHVQELAQEESEQVYAIWCFLGFHS